PTDQGAVGKPAPGWVSPPTPPPGFARHIHHISNAMVETAPSLADVEDEVLAALGGRTIVAHNAHVDVDVLKRELPGWEPVGVFDTLRLARRLVPDLTSFKLG